MPDRVYNFNPGPATLPVDVLKEAQANLVNYANAGMSILEISHRSKEFIGIIDRAIELVKEIMDLPKSRRILFVQGGASSQFAMIPMNFLRGKKANYINTGSWAKKAIAEAKLFGEVVVAGDSSDANFNYIPKEADLKIAPDAEYLHYTTNNTIFGTEFSYIPNADMPLIADMSSDIFSRKMDFSRFDMIYAGAQKNMGPAGVTMVAISDSLLEKCPDNIPTMFKYTTHAEKNSLFNTPPVFAIYVVKLTLEWILKQGGLKAVEKTNRAKADTLYGAMADDADFYRCAVPDRASRSWMNAAMRLPTEELEKKFIAEAAAEGFHGLKGHRSVGGIRVSMYNAMPLEGIEKLAVFMKAFREKN